MTETNPATYANAVPLHLNPWIVTAARVRPVPRDPLGDYAPPSWTACVGA
jgi:hypothetical protein